MPGTVTDKKKPAGDTWLSDEGQGEGAPIPSQIADKLRGREFASFDSFRRAFWKAVSEHAELTTHFKGKNLMNVKEGKSPFVSESERVGGRQKHEPHHVNSISLKGAVYDIDNIKIMTPKSHIEIHGRGN